MMNRSSESVPSFLKSSSQVCETAHFSLGWILDLLWNLVALRVNRRYKETLLGYGWFFLQPVALTVIFTYIFGRFFSFGSEGIPYPLFVALGLVPWSLTSLVVNHSAYAMTSFQLLLKRVAFPRILLPLSAVIACGVDLGAMGLLLGILFIAFKFSLSWAAAWTLLLVAIHLTLLVGLSCLVSLASVFFSRDIGQAIPFVLQLWFFSSPVFYSSSLLPEPFQALLRWNPLTGLIEGYRAALLFGIPPTFDLVGPAVWVSLSLFALGLITFWRFEGEVPDFL